MRDGSDNTVVISILSDALSVNPFFYENANENAKKLLRTVKD